MSVKPCILILCENQDFAKLIAGKLTMESKEKCLLGGDMERALIVSFDRFLVVVTSAQKDMDLRYTVFSEAWITDFVKDEDILIDVMTRVIGDWHRYHEIPDWFRVWIQEVLVPLHGKLL